MSSPPDYESIRDSKLETYAFSESSIADHNVRTVANGRRFVVFEAYLKARGANTISIKSGSTVIAGPINMTTDDVFQIGGNGSPVLRGMAGGDNLVIALSAATQVDGFVTLATQDNRE